MPIFKWRTLIFHWYTSVLKWRTLLRLEFENLGSLVHWALKDGLSSLGFGNRLAFLGLSH